jgi:hypothetical protein
MPIEPDYATARTSLGALIDGAPDHLVGMYACVLEELDELWVTSRSKLPGARRVAPEPPSTRLPAPRSRWSPPDRRIGSATNCAWPVSTPHGMPRLARSRRWTCSHWAPGGSDRNKDAFSIAAVCFGAG